MTLRPLILIPALALAGGGLAACGKTGELERPAPMFGTQAKEDYEAQKTARAAAKAAEDARTRETLRNNTVFDPQSGPAPQAPFAPPLPGRTDPFGPPPVSGSGANSAAGE
jgi:hypothetical protein